ncbi:MAG: cation:proton antiporter [Fibrobacterota bacterium]
MIENTGNFFSPENPHILLLSGTIVLASYLLSLILKKTRLPSILAYMLTGIILGPSFFGILGEELLGRITFVTNGVLSFVAFKIGLDIDIKKLKRKGRAILKTTVFESFGAFIAVTVSVWLICGNLPLALLLGAAAPASAPAGTLAVIDEYKAKGPLSETMISIVGIDDALGVIIFGLITPLASVLIGGFGSHISSTPNMLAEFGRPFAEIILSLMLGFLSGKLFTKAAREDMSMKSAMTEPV